MYELGSVTWNNLANDAIATTGHVQHVPVDILSPTRKCLIEVGNPSGHPIVNRSSSCLVLR